MAETGQVRNNEARSRFEMEVEGATAVAQYKREGDVLRFTHTIVPQEFEGRGVGSKLVRGALEESRRLGLKVDPICPFVRAFIDRYPEFEDVLVA